MKNPHMIRPPSGSKTPWPRLLNHILLGCATIALAGAIEVRAGTQYWDPDGDPSNNNVDGTGTGALGGVASPIGPIPWEWAYWTDDSNLPGSIQNPLVNFNEGDDVIFWGTNQPVAGTAPTIKIELNAAHTVNSMSFYSVLITNLAYNYTLLPGTGDIPYITNITGVINTDGGPESYKFTTVGLVSTIGVPLVSTNGFKKLGNGSLTIKTNTIISGGPIIIDGRTRPGFGGNVTLPTAAQWNVTANGPYQPFPLDAQIIITNGGSISLNGTRLISSKPIIAWDGTIGGSGGVQAPQFILRTTRFGYNAFSGVMEDDGTGNSTLLKTGNTYINMYTVANNYKGGTIISQGEIQWVFCTATNSCLGTNTITMGDANTGTNDVGLGRGGALPTVVNTNLINNIAVTTNGTGRVFIGNQACNGVIRMSGNVSLGRSAILGGSGSAVNGPNYTIAQRGTIFDGVISGPGGVIVQGASGLFYSPTDPFVSPQVWYSGGTVKLTNPGNSYSGGSTVSWGTLQAGVDGALGTGSVTVNSPGILLLDTAQGIAASANLTLGGTAPRVDLNFAGTCTINALSLDGGMTYATSGTFGSPTSDAANKSSFLTNNGVLKIVTTQTGSATTLASSRNPANLNAIYDANVQFTATVGSVGAGNPTGTVTFQNGAAVLGTVPLVGGVATFTASNLPSGTNAITARYSGDANFVPSGAALYQIVYTDLSTTNVATGITAGAPGTFNLAFQGTPGVYYSVVTSTSIEKPMAQWTLVPGSTTLVSDPAGAWSITVTNMATAAQYYRAMVAGTAP